MKCPFPHFRGPNHSTNPGLIGRVLWAPLLNPSRIFELVQVLDQTKQKGRKRLTKQNVRRTEQWRGRKDERWWWRWEKGRGKGIEVEWLYQRVEWAGGTSGAAAWFVRCCQPMGGQTRTNRCYPKKMTRRPFAGRRLSVPSPTARAHFLLVKGRPAKSSSRRVAPSCSPRPPCQPFIFLPRRLADNAKHSASRISKRNEWME